MDARVKKAIATLERYCPTDMPVLVLEQRLSGVAGDTDSCRTHYMVRVNPGVSYMIALPCGTIDSKLDTLAHEWAHAMVWKSSRLEHGELFGRAYSWAYRVVIERWRPKKRFDPAKMA